MGPKVYISLASWWIHLWNCNFWWHISNGLATCLEILCYPRRLAFLFSKMNISYLLSLQRSCSTLPSSNELTWFILFFFFNSFIWLHQVLVVARGIFSCGLWNLVPWLWIEPGLPALGMRNFSNWTTREVPVYSFLKKEKNYWNIVKKKFIEFACHPFAQGPC